ncbi:hypothetical protein BGW38_002961 [Lunasporangiospora selenospora]|uniref:Trm112p-like protein n=1 Tax=Lunasporangiospora selenospora TaxID=979761 RepID=A0A9P6FRV5_9FUNG|nr:hypothetical protein BGW38_002961 [Lunasporangiospora selenospora]
MRLITHNMLQCHVKGCNANNFPLDFQDVSLEQQEAELNEDFLRNMLGKIEYGALVATCLKLNITDLPSTMPADANTNEEFLQALHRVMLETHVISGKMVCPNCSHIYIIRDGIPNMLLAEHEV